MPNGTLCGKAVVEMLLGEESGAPHDYVAEKLVRTGNLPQAYVITEERMERAMKLDEVRVQDEKGIDGTRWEGTGKEARLV